MIDLSNSKKQWEKRVDIFKYIYQCLLLETKSDSIKKDALDDYNFDAQQMLVIEYIADNLNELINEIKPYISNNWNWERIAYTDKSILLSSIAEYRIIKTHKNIIIDQALITASNYTLDDNYKYINAILEKILNKCTDGE